MNNESSFSLMCFSNDAIGSCRKRDWGNCGYDWLAKVPVGLVWLVWFFGGSYALSHFGALKFDTRIHDPLGQGIAIALSQRKATAVRRPWLLRYIKLCAIWAEWPTFTFTPLTIAFKIAGQDQILRGLSLNFDSVFEILGVLIVTVCGLAILILRQWKSHPSSDAILKRILYPITFDLFFIPTISILIRMGTCPEGLNHVVMPNGATCECIDQYVGFWIIGFGGFIILYCSSMFYKMHIEPHTTTMDFRFQTSFQILMAMARTINPIVSILVILLDVQNYPARATPILCIFLVLTIYLLIHSYKTQPCIGSGRIPNNFRVVSFSSSVYTSLCVLIFCVVSADQNALYYSLTPLPLVWLVTWFVNDRRAKLYYIPYLPIVDLLTMSESRPRMAGVIAALYADPTKIPVANHSTIITLLYSIARSIASEPLSRVYALRTLWFFHAKNFRKTKGHFGEPEQKDNEESHSDLLPPRLWYKDCDNPDRVNYTKAAMRKSTDHTPDRVKICRIDNLSDVGMDEPSSIFTGQGQSQRSISRGLVRQSIPTEGETEEPTSMEVGYSVSSPRLNHNQPTNASFMMTKRMSVFPIGEHSIIRIRDKQWISCNELPHDAVVACDELYSLALDVLKDCAAISYKVALYEAALYLLQLYQARYLRLKKTTYIQILCSLCATSNLKMAIDAVHTMYKLILDQVLMPELWLHSPSCLDSLHCALSHPSITTVAKCSIIAKSVLIHAEADASANLFSLLTPASIARLRCAFLDHHANFQISTTLEDICTCLHRMEVSRGLKKHDVKSNPVRWIAPTSLMRNITTTLLSAKSQVSNRTSGMSLASRRLSLRVQPDPVPTPSSDVHRDIHSQPLCVVSYDLDGSMTKMSGAQTVPSTPNQTPLAAPMPKEVTSHGTKVQYLFVQADVVEEIRRRRMIRKQFEQALMRAYNAYNEFQPNQSTKEGSTRINSQTELPPSFGEIMGLYAVPGCALEGMLSSVVDADIKTFFETQVMPFMISR